MLICVRSLQSLRLRILSPMNLALSADSRSHKSCTNSAPTIWRIYRENALDARASDTDQSGAQPFPMRCHNPSHQPTHSRRRRRRRRFRASPSLVECASAPVTSAAIARAFVIGFAQPRPKKTHSHTKNAASERTIPIPPSPHPQVQIRPARTGGGRPLAHRSAGDARRAVSVRRL